VRAGTARRSKRYLPSRRHPTTAGRTALRKKGRTCAIGDRSKSAPSARACAIHAGRRHRPSSGERAAAGRTVMCGEVLKHVRIEVVVAAPTEGRAPALVHARSAATRPNDSKRGLSGPATARDPAGPRLACAARALRSGAVHAKRAHAFVAEQGSGCRMSARSCVGPRWCSKSCEGSAAPNGGGQKSIVWLRHKRRCCFVVFRVLRGARGVPRRVEVVAVPR
jgi:hypothetical protein